MSYKIRFHLGKGENYLKWQIKTPEGDVLFFPPEEVNIGIVNGKLVNQKGTARKIYEGANKTVCAWIEAERIYILKPSHFGEKGTEVSYNPRVYPAWMHEGNNVDGVVYKRLTTRGRKIFKL